MSALRCFSAQGRRRASAAVRQAALARGDEVVVAPPDSARLIRSITAPQKRIGSCIIVIVIVITIIIIIIIIIVIIIYSYCYLLFVIIISVNTSIISRAPTNKYRIVEE